MRAPQSARREQAGNEKKANKGAMCFWTQNVIYSNPCSIYPHGGILTYQ